MRGPRQVSVVGTVVAFPPSGSVTVRSESPAFPVEGAMVSDDRGRFSGKVVRVFGPVSRPYWSVRTRRPLSPADAAELLGRTLTSA